MPDAQKPIEIFVSYHPEDEQLYLKLRKHLNTLHRNGLITTWSNFQLVGGDEKLKILEEHLTVASIILLLISADFLASKECYQVLLRALIRHKCKKARVIPIILRPCDWESTKSSPDDLQVLSHDYGSVTRWDDQEATFPSLTDLQVLPHNCEPVTRWEHEDEAFLDIARGLHQVIEQPPSPTRPITPSPPNQQNHRKEMLALVRQRQSPELSHSTTSILFHLQDRSDLLGLDRQNLPDGTTIMQEYKEAHGELLILGDMGAGKTVLLLELAHTLLEQAEVDEQRPIPIIFNLGLWKKGYRSLNEWLIAQLSDKYRISLALAREYVDGNHVLPLLDELDKVTKDERIACVQQINDYCKLQREQAHQSRSIFRPIVVCCRSKEFNELFPHRIQLRRAVSILPLTDSQVDAYFAHTGEQAHEIKQYIDEDEEMSELVFQQPLMLHIFTQTYQGTKLAGLPFKEILKTVFSRYAEERINKGSKSSDWKPEKVNRYLHFLAEQMQKRNQKAFLTENLRPSWLPPFWKNFYYICTVVVIGGIIGGGVGQVFGVHLGLLFGLIFGPAIGLGIGRDTEIDRKKIGQEMAKRLGNEWRKVKDHKERFGPYIGMLFMAIPTVFSILIVGLLFGLFWLITRGLIGIKASINFVDWRLERAKRYGLVGLTIGFISGVAIDLGIGLGEGQIAGLAIGPLVAVGTCLSLTLLCGLIAGLTGGFSLRRLPKHFSSPNTYILESGKLGFVIGLLVGITIAIAGLIGQFGGGPIIAVLIALILGLIAALVFGLDAFVQHFIVLFFLSLRGEIPKKLTAFLDEMATWSLLQKEGRGYRFKHQELLKCFAAKTKEEFANV